MLYDSHIVSTLTHFYLDSNTVKVYNGRWDTYLAAEGLWNEYFYLMLKPDNEVNRIVTQARENAKDVTNSPLSKAMSEN